MLIILYNTIWARARARAHEAARWCALITCGVASITLVLKELRLDVFCGLGVVALPLFHFFIRGIFSSLSPRPQRTIIDQTVTAIRNRVVAAHPTELLNGSGCGWTCYQRQHSGVVAAFGKPSGFLCCTSISGFFDRFLNLTFHFFLHFLPFWRRLGLSTGVLSFSRLGLVREAFPLNFRQKTGHRCPCWCSICCHIHFDQAGRHLWPVVDF